MLFGLLPLAVAVYLVVAAFIGRSAARVARSKGRGAALWAVLAFLLPIMLIAVLVLPPAGAGAGVSAR